MDAFWVHEDVFGVSYFLDIGGCLVCSLDLRADRIVRWLLQYVLIIDIGLLLRTGVYSCFGYW